jgi:hypothetical protein
MKEAQQLYRASGFRENESYEGGEIPKEFQNHWIFMEKLLKMIKVKEWANMVQSFACLAP